MPILPTCGRLAHPRFRRASEDQLTPCCAEPNHEGNHVYGIADQGSVRYYEEVARDKLKVAVLCDLKRGAKLTNDEVAATWQFLEWRKVQQHD